MPDAVRRIAEAARLDDAQLQDRAHMLERVLLLQTEVGAAEAELSCLDDQLETLQEELDRRREDFELTFTLASIAVGALGAVASGVLELTLPDSGAAPTAGIVSGVASATLGMAAFWAPREDVELEHERNLLAALYNRAPVEEGLLSGFLVRALDAPRGDAPSPRETLRLEWDETLSELDPRAPEILFGLGGRYDAAMLAGREILIERLETEILQIRQDLELLLRFLYRMPPE